VLIRAFGVETSFDFRQIGGTDSFFRRLAVELCRRGHTIEFVHYACEQEGEANPIPNLRVKKFTSFGDALADLAAASGPVLVNAVNASDRLHFIRFRRRMRGTIDFYMVYSLFAHTLVGRLKHFLEAVLYPYQPGTICMSHRLVKYVRAMRNRAELLLPPVPVDYFASLEEKPGRENLVVAYVGRLEAGKGAHEAVELLEALSRESHVEARVSGYTFRKNGEAGELRQRLRRNGRILFQEREHRGWTWDLETQIAAELRDIDVLLLPYRRVSSSIDTPLLLLEGMAALCCCATPPLGDIPRVYGPSPFLLPGHDFVRRTFRLISEGGRDLIERERQRIHARIREFPVDTPSAADRLLDILQKR
jgi:glycosyltransferase involved in cell wall biosynthesis